MINNNTFESVQPSLNTSRSQFDFNSKHLTTFNEGKLVPMYIAEVLPGDTFQMDTNILLRLSTLLTPIMDDLYLDTYFFFIPNRLIWEHWKEFMGENTTSYWIPTTTYSVPQITSPSSTGWIKGSLMDYLGIPIGITGLSVSALPVRAYVKVYNEWFRDQNLQAPSLEINSDATTTGDNTNVYNGGALFNVAKFGDLFTHALPSPQKHADVTLPLGDNAFVYPGSVIDFDTYKAKYSPWSPMKFASSNSTTQWNYSNGPLGTFNNDGQTAVGSTSYTAMDAVVPVNMYADLSTATATTINQLRIAFQMQKLYEKDARGGTRYIEMIKTHFNVDSPDARLQRTEFLGGDRCAINIQSIYQTSATASGQTPQGNVSAYSVTFSRDSSFTKSFTEHGLILGVCCVRHRHVYQQGIQKLWSKTDRLDYYLPVLANIGEQPLYNREIYAQGTSTDSQVFGYQEAWYDYRYMPSRVSGEFRSTYATPLDSWHLADNYSALPVLNNAWIEESSNSLDRCLAVKSTIHDQFLADFYFNCKVTRCMPLYSVPGLIDHN